MNTDQVWYCFTYSDKTNNRKRLLALIDGDTFEEYRKRVWVITESQDLSMLSGIHMRGFWSYHIDHIISIWDGWKNRIPAEQIGSIENLRMLPWKENLAKGRKSAKPFR